LSTGLRLFLGDRGGLKLLVVAAQAVVVLAAWVYAEASASVSSQFLRQGSSGTYSPYGIRSWKCRMAAVSDLGIEIASASPTLGGSKLNYISAVILGAVNHDAIFASHRHRFPQFHFEPMLRAT